ncbi:MAG TPA: STAS domain-containing protein [Polyangiaceae bacterium]|nr:STAS domain-containing protein [Polyangiaceae bacterium]
MSEGRVLYAGHDHAHVLRYVGDVRHSLAPSVTGFVDALLDREPDAELLFDFSQAEIIDSTNLGAIARIADRVTTSNGKRVTIFSPRAEITQVLFSMAFDEVFDICTEGTPGAGGAPIPRIDASREASSQTVLLAHQRLMQMNESNREQFRELVELMERELASADEDENRRAKS